MAADEPTTARDERSHRVPPRNPRHRRSVPHPHKDSVYIWTSSVQHVNIEPGPRSTNKQMERSTERELEILTAIGEGRPLTQRALAQRLGIALGLTNLYLKRLAKKGSIKITEFPRKPHARKRLRYVLTPKGLLEKTRLTYDYLSYSLGIYRRTRETLREALGHLNGQ